LSFKFVVFSLQQMVKNLKPVSTNCKLCTTNRKAKGPRMMAEAFVRRSLFCGLRTARYSS
ncbi:hypothetical protein, partial [Megasphaera sp.]|uniref:hypothetical protein n=1 Tax=Megasphaera sp. TaxID=2023260 RepID=UPI0025C1248C